MQKALCNVDGLMLKAAVPVVAVTIKHSDLANQDVTVSTTRLLPVPA